jgi:very-short-patch-repair endonuclease
MGVSPRDGTKKQFARQLRTRMTDAELELWKSYGVVSWKDAVFVVITRSARRCGFRLP